MSNKIGINLGYLLAFVILGGMLGGNWALTAQIAGIVALLMAGGNVVHGSIQSLKRKQQ